MKNILLVESNTRKKSIMKKLLEEKGFIVESAETTIEAIKLMEDKKNSYNIISISSPLKLTAFENSSTVGGQIFIDQLINKKHRGTVILFYLDEPYVRKECVYPFLFLQLPEKKDSTENLSKWVNLCSESAL